MRVIPAIDLMGGKCVRLRQGSFAEATAYGDDPLAMALTFVDAGANLIHLVDLDGARAGCPVQAEIVRRIAQAVPVPVEVGGGLRTLDQIGAYLENGVSRVVLGSAAVKAPALLRDAIACYDERVILGLDTRQGFAATDGWTASSGRDALTLAREMAGYGLKELIYTDIARDGMLSGPDLEGLSALVRGAGLTVIASGGISSLADLEAVAKTGAGGAIVGKAIYEGRLDLREAVLRMSGISKNAAD